MQRVNAQPTFTDAAVADLGGERRVEAVVELGELTADDAAVQLLHGPVGPNDELAETSIVTMSTSEGR